MVQILIRLPESGVQQILEKRGFLFDDAGQFALRVDAGGYSAVDSALRAEVHQFVGEIQLIPGRGGFDSVALKFFGGDAEIGHRSGKQMGRAGHIGEFLLEVHRKVGLLLKSVHGGGHEGRIGAGEDVGVPAEKGAQLFRAQNNGAGLSLHHGPEKIQRLGAFPAVVVPHASPVELVGPGRITGVDHADESLHDAMDAHAVRHIERALGRDRDGSGFLIQKASLSYDIRLHEIHDADPEDRTGRGIRGRFGFRTGIRSGKQGGDRKEKDCGEFFFAEEFHFFLRELKRDTRAPDRIPGAGRIDFCSLHYFENRILSSGLRQKVPAFRASWERLRQHPHDAADPVHDVSAEKSEIVFLGNGDADHLDERGSGVTHGQGTAQEDDQDHDHIFHEHGASGIAETSPGRDPVVFEGEVFHLEKACSKEARKSGCFFSSASSS